MSTTKIEALQWNTQSIDNPVNPLEYVQHVPLQYPGVEEDSSRQVVQKCLALFRVRQNWGGNAPLLNTRRFETIASSMYAPQPSEKESGLSFPDTGNAATTFNMVYGLAGNTHMIVSSEASIAASDDVLVFLCREQQINYYALMYALENDHYRLEVTAGDAGDQVTVTPTTSSSSDNGPGKMLHAKWVPKHSPVWTRFNDDIYPLTLDQEKTYWVHKTGSG